MIYRHFNKKAMRPRAIRPVAKTESEAAWQRRLNLQEIGRGAYGVVYLAKAFRGARVALKVCRREDVGDERYGRELRGAKLYKAIPPEEGLVHMIDLVEKPWGFYTVMELADNEFGASQVSSSDYHPKTLASVINGEKALPLTECVKLAVSLAKGLAALQRHHLLHRDIKPANVLYVKGKPVLSDPGLVVEESEAASLVGTPGYVPPEQFTDAASDIYSLGLTLKAASFGRQIEELDKGPAMEADTGSPLFLAWWRILNKATNPTPSSRYQSAKALLKDLHMLECKVFLASRKSLKRWIGVFLLPLILVPAVFAVAVFATIFVNERKEKEPVGEVNEEPVKKDAESTPWKNDVERYEFQLKMQKFILDASSWFETAANTATSAYTLSDRMRKYLRNKIEETADAEGVEKLSLVQTELLELKGKLREIAVKICILHIEYNARHKGDDYPTKSFIEEKLQAAQKLLKEGDKLQRRTWEIGTIIYGAGWEPKDRMLNKTSDGALNAASIYNDAMNRIKGSIKGSQDDLQTLQ